MTQSQNDPILRITNQASIYRETTSINKVKLLRAAWCSWNEDGSGLDCRARSTLQSLPAFAWSSTALPLGKGCCILAL